MSPRRPQQRGHHHSTDQRRVCKNWSKFLCTCACIIIDIIDTLRESIYLWHNELATKLGSQINTIVCLQFSSAKCSVTRTSRLSADASRSKLKHACTDTLVQHTAKVHNPTHMRITSYSIYAHVYKYTLHHISPF